MNNSLHGYVLQYFTDIAGLQHLYVHTTFCFDAHLLEFVTGPKKIGFMTHLHKIHLQYFYH